MLTSRSSLRVEKLGMRSDTSLGCVRDQVEGYLGAGSATLSASPSVV